jgi:hypothetical protein
MLLMSIVEEPAKAPISRTEVGDFASRTSLNAHWSAKLIQAGIVFIQRR